MFNSTNNLLDWCAEISYFSITCTGIEILPVTICIGFSSPFLFEVLQPRFPLNQNNAQVSFNVRELFVTIAKTAML